MVLNLLTISTVWLNSKAAQKVEFSPKYRHVKKPLWVLSGPICVINRSFIYLEVSISWFSYLRVLNIHNINSLKDVLNSTRVKNLKSGSSKNTLRSLLPLYERVENLQEFVVEPDEAYERKGVPSSLQDFFPLPVHFQNM